MRGTDRSRQPLELVPQRPGGSAPESNLPAQLTPLIGREQEIAAARGTDPQATGKVLDALLAHGYLRYRNGQYELNRLSRKWLLADRPHTVVHKLDFQEIEWR